VKNFLAGMAVGLGLLLKKSRGRKVRVVRYSGCRRREKRKMAKNRLRKAAMSIGAAMGKADRTAHKVAKAGVLAKGELEDISKQIDALKRQLLKTTKRLKKALS
jgi:hypothetical protein